jgi:hypothetical protein
VRSTKDAEMPCFPAYLCCWPPSKRFANVTRVTNRGFTLIELLTCRGFTLIELLTYRGFTLIELLITGGSRSSSF